MTPRIVATRRNSELYLIHLGGSSYEIADTKTGKRTRTNGNVYDTGPWSLLSNPPRGLLERLMSLPHG